MKYGKPVEFGLAWAVAASHYGSRRLPRVINVLAE